MLFKSMQTRFTDACGSLDFRNCYCTELSARSLGYISVVVGNPVGPNFNVVLLNRIPTGIRVKGDLVEVHVNVSSATEYFAVRKLVDNTVAKLVAGVTGL